MDGRWREHEDGYHGNRSTNFAGDAHRMAFSCGRTSSLRRFTQGPTKPCIEKPPHRIDSGVSRHGSRTPLPKTPPGWPLPVDGHVMRRAETDPWENLSRASYSSSPAQHGHSHGERSPNRSGLAPSLPYIVIRERVAIQEHSEPAACVMERTASGLSISSDISAYEGRDDRDDGLLEDMEAAHFVSDHVAALRRTRPNSRPARILHALINPKSRGADFPLDNDALSSIFSAANELFFANRLKRRVFWDWSHEDAPQYQQHIVGTTCFRRRPAAAGGGYETLIVLSSPILSDTKYNRRLLISTFLHEMIHCYLFVSCGFKARHCGGHTDGFRHIAKVIDAWVGPEHLRLTEMESGLDHFTNHVSNTVGHHNGHHCHAWQSWHGPTEFVNHPLPPPHEGFLTSHPGEWRRDTWEGDDPVSGEYARGVPYV